MTDSSFSRTWPSLARMLIADSFGHRQNDARSTQSYWADRGGKILSRYFTVPSVRGFPAGAAAYNEKIRALPCNREFCAGAAAGVRSDILMLLHIPGF
jgi:hypothetical protein